eukprot:1158000-Pelagomonas_calceolata.AAC.4
MHSHTHTHTLQGRVTHGLEDVLPKTEAAHDFAQGLGELMLGISRLPHHVSLWSRNVNTSIQQQSYNGSTSNSSRCVNVDVMRGRSVHPQPQQPIPAIGSGTIAQFLAGTGGLNTRARESTPATCK